MAGPIEIQANYVRAPFGGWIAVVWGTNEPPHSVSGATPETVFDAVTAAVAEVADRRAVSCVTVHALEGDPAAFVPFAARHRLGERS